MTVTDMAAYRELSDADARTAARRDLRADPTLSGAAVGKRYGRSDEWGRKQKRYVERNGTPARTGTPTVTPPVPVNVSPAVPVEPTRAVEHEPARPPDKPTETAMESARTVIDVFLLLGGLAAMVAVGWCAASWSFTHIYDLAVLIGASPHLARQLPICVDGMVALGSLLLLRDEIAGRRRDPWAVVAVVVGVAASIGANAFMELRQGDAVGAVVAMYPPTALFLVGHLFLRLIRPTRKDPS